MRHPGPKVDRPTAPPRRWVPAPTAHGPMTVVCGSTTASGPIQIGPSRASSTAKASTRAPRSTVTCSGRYTATLACTSPRIAPGRLARSWANLAAHRAGQVGQVLGDRLDVPLHHLPRPLEHTRLDALARQP